MCGIAGILRLSERPLPGPGALRRMLAAIGHRGPDGDGVFASDDVQLGAVRLAIQDPAGGRQPLRSRGGELVSVFNGEIYNHRALRTDLAARGRRVEDACDASVVVPLYEERGPELVHELRGMFAFALWDARRRRLLLARDRVGIKPLLWARTADYLMFASEAKALFASGLVEAEIDRDALDDLFSLHYPCPPRTMFRGVLELRPAHVGTAEPGRPELRQERYWRAGFVPRGEHRRVRRADAEAELRERLTAVVADHLQADVPVATYLSGGLDSSAISALASRVRGTPPVTFSIGFADPKHDESDHARAMADALSAPHHFVTCDRSTAEAYPESVRQIELPLMVPLGLPLGLLAQRAREHGFPVILTGEGADELLAGYDCFRGQRMRRLFDRPGLRALRRPAYGRLYRWHGMPDGALEAMLAAQSRPAAELAPRFGGVLPAWYDVWHLFDVERERLLSPDGRDVRPIDEPPEGFTDLVRDDAADLHPLDAELALELESRLPAWVLLFGDRASMARGVEARVPFLDHELIDWLAPLHPDFKLRRFREKSILRGAMRGVLPEPIRRRTKRPFYTPIGSWFFDPGAPEYVEELLAPPALERAGLFTPEVVTELRNRFRAAAPNHFDRMRLELLLMLVLGTQLLDHHFVRGGAP
ncbi:MAG: asparagine synthase (glutamine-hydrolyzing) [Planctomycetota bacterium]